LTPEAVAAFKGRQFGLRSKRRRKKIRPKRDIPAIAFLACVSGSFI